jgi:hypothetical protein
MRKRLPGDHHTDAHDKAYAWARNKLFEMHPKTGVFQIFDAQVTTEAAATATSESTARKYPRAAPA